MPVDQADLFLRIERLQAERVTLKAEFDTLIAERKKLVLRFEAVLAIRFADRAKTLWGLP